MTLPSELRIGVPQIDREHAHLMKLLNNVAGHAQDDIAAERFHETVSRIGREITEHFVSEENFLRSCGMSVRDVEQHVAAHTDIIEQMTALSFDLMEKRRVAPQAIAAMIRGWIVDHLREHDLKLRSYAHAA